MKRAELEALGLTKEQIDTIMEQNGKDINNAKKNSIEPNELERLQGIEKKYKELEDADLTDAEKVQKAIREAEEAKIEFAKKTNKLEVEKVLVKAGLTEDDYKELIDGIVSDNSEQSLKMANSLATMLGAQIKKAEDKTKESLLDGTKNPGGNEPPKDEKTEAEKIAESLGKAAGTSNETKSIVDSYL